MSVSVFAFALESRMRIKGISVEEFSSSLGYIHSPIVRMWLEGRTRPCVDQLPEIAERLDMDVVQLGLLYLMDCSECMDKAVRHRLSMLGMWPEIAGANVRARVAVLEDMSVSDPHDADGEVPF